MSELVDLAPLKDAAWWHAHRTGRAWAPDGVGLHYEVVGQGPRTLLLANGLGGRLYAWRPIIDALWPRYKLITWDYRGLFNSDSPPSPRQLSVAHHVDDACAVLDAEGVSRAVFVGWSMGVQLSLDLAATRPARVAGLVLINGTYGHVLEHGFQPLLSMPGLPRRLHQILEWLRAHPWAANHIATLGRGLELPTLGLFLLTAGTRAPKLRPFLRQYLSDVLGPSFPTYLRLFQELDAHSVYHLLPEMQHARHLRLARAGHFAIIERPETVVPAIEEFLAREAAW